MYFTNLCSSEIARVVQDDLNRVVQWTESSSLIPNQGKTKSVLFGSWQNLAKSPYCIQLPKDHVEYVSSKVSRRLGLLSRIQSCLTLEASKQVYTSLL